jgi:polysaccharide chain length determinant protein (PEP-CTERM system associated)
MAIHSEERTLGEVKVIAWAAFRRYWRYGVIPAFLIVSGVLAAAYLLPDYFTSRASVLIQPQKISSRIITPDGRESREQEDMAERVEILAQEILSRSKLRSVIEQFSLYPGSTVTGEKGKEEAIETLQKAIKLQPAAGPNGKPLSHTFELSFTHADPKIAHQIANQLSNLFINESILSTRAEALGSQEWIDAQLSEARAKQETIEGQIQQFVRSNFGKLPDHLNAAVARLENVQAQIETNTKIIESNTQRRNHLRDELNSVARAAITSVVPGNIEAGTPQENLAQLEAALIALKSRYSDQHPDVIATRNRIEALKGQLANGSVKATTPDRYAISTPTGNLAFNLRNELNQVEVQISTLQAENQRLKEQASNLQKNIDEMPVKEQELLKIKRDYESVRTNYERLLKARDDAALQSSLIKSQKGTQLKLVNPAEVPLIPAGPQRKMIAGVGVVAGLLIALAVPLIAFFFNTGFKFRSDVESELGMPVMGVIPAIKSEKPRRRNVDEMRSAA